MRAVCPAATPLDDEATVLLFNAVCAAQLAPGLVPEPHVVVQSGDTA